LISTLILPGELLLLLLFWFLLSSLSRGCALLVLEVQGGRCCAGALLKGVDGAASGAGALVVDVQSALRKPHEAKLRRESAVQEGDFAEGVV
jgi:hypothetical protein